MSIGMKRWSGIDCLSYKDVADLESFVARDVVRSKGEVSS